MIIRLLVKLIVGLGIAIAAFFTTFWFLTPENSEIVIAAKDFTKGSGVEVGSQHGEGIGVLHNGPPYTAGSYAAEFELEAPENGNYLWQAEYASAESRPIEL